MDSFDTDLPASYALADWRRRIGDLYRDIRAIDDAEAAWRFWRLTRMEMFRSHPMSPVSPETRAKFAAIPVYAYDPDLRFTVGLRDAEGDALDFDLGADGEMRATPLALTDGLKPVLGSELTLYWIGGYGGGLFLPFKDATAGTETYGGGRYLLDAIKGADLGPARDGGGIVLDFNFAYNPSCAVNPAYVCPLSPPENTLPEAVRGGEKDPDFAS
ncbi:DUF1684 domain-containing protein [Oricola cellulosilytica]|uniref:DUF1684 domain-containing protein n=1 Tax=Oricola cellulosilytica TaxID=1429082 RepID=A0A4R0PH33_9HYPH|nr:DUF1684 domain-containing protein [Oricola cellulosilytica]TCD16114.1 DUF1684 domain-containing protein [Oricola cellulosilytica]